MKPSIRITISALLIVVVAALVAYFVYEKYSEPTSKTVLPQKIKMSINDIVTYDQSPDDTYNANLVFTLYKVGKLSDAFEKKDGDKYYFNFSGAEISSVCPAQSCDENLDDAYYLLKVKSLDTEPEKDFDIVISKMFNTHDFDNPPIILTGDSTAPYLGLSYNLKLVEEESDNDKLSFIIVYSPSMPF